MYEPVRLICRQCRYLDASKITKLLLVEPNPGMHDGLRKNALAAGFKEGQFQIVPCGAEEKAKVEQLTGLGHESVDSVVSLLALCGIPDSKSVPTIRYMCRVTEEADALSLLIGKSSLPCMTT